MANGLNRVMLIGNVGQVPEVRATANGSRVATFSLATSRAWRDDRGEKQEKTEWHRCSVWNSGAKGTLADFVEKYVGKGQKIYVEGSIEYRQWQDKENVTRYSTEIRVRELLLLTSGGGETSKTHPSSADTAASEFPDFPPF